MAVFAVLPFAVELRCSMHAYAAVVSNNNVNEAMCF
jgi:hypothetical protein